MNGENSTGGLGPLWWPHPLNPNSGVMHDGCSSLAAVLPDRTAWLCNKCGSGGPTSEVS